MTEPMAENLEVWVTVLGPDGDPISEPLPTVMGHFANGEYVSNLRGTWKLLPGREDVKPAGMRIRFADGREVDGDLPQ